MRYRRPRTIASACCSAGIQSLVTKTSEQASASLRFANAQVTALAAQLEARRSAAGH
jgi:hypothetical protein